MSLAAPADVQVQGGVLLHVDLFEGVAASAQVQRRSLFDIQLMVVAGWQIERLVLIDRDVLITGSHVYHRQTERIGWGEGCALGDRSCHHCAGLEVPKVHAGRRLDVT